MTQDAAEDLDLTPSPVREDAKAPSPDGPNDALVTIYAICTGQPHLGDEASLKKGTVAVVAALKQERDHYHQILKMIAERPRIDPANPESLADVGRFAWTTARRILGIKES